MRIIRPLLIVVALQGVVLAICSGSSDPLNTSARAASSVSAEATPASLLICGKNERICFSCDGSRQFCAEFCPDCIPPVQDPAPTTPSEATLALRSGGACADQI